MMKFDEEVTADEHLSERPDAPLPWPEGEQQLLEAAFGLIVAAYGGNWKAAPIHWAEAAIRWRDAWIRHIARRNRKPRN